MTGKRTVTGRAYFFTGLFFFLLVSAGLLYSASAIWRYLQSAEHQPIAEVLVQGERAHVTTEQVAGVLTDDPATGSFFSVDVDQVRDHLERLPWVEQVSVRKRWPQGLSIYLTEYQAAAHWRDGSLLNAQGVVFEALPGESEAHLPRLAGPDGSEIRVLQTWRLIEESLAASSLAATHLTLDNRGGWELVLADGLRLILGQEMPIERLQRYTRMAPLLDARVDKIPAYVDLRYDTGMAVGWQEPQAEKQQGANAS